MKKHVYCVAHRVIPARASLDVWPPGEPHMAFVSRYLMIDREKQERWVSIDEIKRYSRVNDVKPGNFNPNCSRLSREVFGI